MSMVSRCLWGTTSLCLGITHLVCDFHIILRMWDSSRSHLNTLLGKASDLFEKGLADFETEEQPQGKIIASFQI